jgi:hypothetical protein
MTRPKLKISNAQMARKIVSKAVVYGFRFTIGVSRSRLKRRLLVRLCILARNHYVSAYACAAGLEHKRTGLSISPGLNMSATMGEKFQYERSE